MDITTSVFVATSLDGFIARMDGAIDWLNDANALVSEGEDLGFQAFMDSVDALVMGRKTFEQVLTFGAWPYGDTPVVVLSRRPLKIPLDLPGTVSYASEPPRELLAHLAEQGIRHVYVDGGQTIQGFLAESLIDQIIITTIPILLGEGIPLFGPLDQDIHLTHVSTAAFNCGFVQSTYRVKKMAATS